MTRRITWPTGGSNGGGAVSDVDDGKALPANGVPVTMADVTAAVGVLPTIPQPSIANIPTSALTLLTDVIARTNATVVALNTLLAELRAAGILSP